MKKLKSEISFLPFYLFSQHHSIHFVEVLDSSCLCSLVWENKLEEDFQKLKLSSTDYPPATNEKRLLVMMEIWRNA